MCFARVNLSSGARGTTSRRTNAELPLSALEPIARLVTLLEGGGACGTRAHRVADDGSRLGCTLHRAESRARKSRAGAVVDQWVAACRCSVRRWAKARDSVPSAWRAASSNVSSWV
jgi:hypothetical protein